MCLVNLPGDVAGASPVRLEIWYVRALGGPLELVAIEDRGAWVIPLTSAAATVPAIDPAWEAVPARELRP